MVKRQLGGCGGMLVHEAEAIAGRLGTPGKMPGTSYGLPATACKTGARLVKVPGTVCHQCYALPAAGTQYKLPNAQKGMARRLASLSHPLWVEAMVTLLKAKHSRAAIRVDLGMAGVRKQRAGGARARWVKPGYHRWHDSGDLQSVSHLAKIVEVCERTPRIKHWLPTQELGMVRRFLEWGGTIPNNLCIRVSSVRLDDYRRRNWPTTSSVFTAFPPEGSHTCPAPMQGHQCGSCRACWSHAVPHVAYEFHR